MNPVPLDTLDLKVGAQIKVKESANNNLFEDRIYEIHDITTGFSPHEDEKAATFKREDGKLASHNYIYLKDIKGVKVTMGGRKKSTKKRTPTKKRRRHTKKRRRHTKKRRPTKKRHYKNAY